MSGSAQMAFRQMLAKLSNIITERELNSLKYQCTDVIPRAYMEDIEESHSLWLELEEKGKVSVDNTQFLEDILSVACIGNQRVLEVLEEYKRTAESTVEGEDLQSEFDFLRRDLGRDWRPLARKLGLSEVDIESIEEKYDKDLREQVSRCLMVWKRQNKNGATKQALVQALRACNKNMLAHQVENLQ